MTFRNTEYLIVVSHDEAGTEQFAHLQISRVQLAPDGTPFPAAPIEFEQPSELGPVLAGLNASIIQQNNYLRDELAHKNQSHPKEIADLQQQIDSQAEVFHLQRIELENQLAAAQAEAASNAAAAQLGNLLQSQVAELQARVVSLMAIAPFDPRKITVKAFYKRLRAEETLMLLTDTDAGVRQIAGMLSQWAQGDENGPWPIVFDSPEFQQAMEYLVEAGKLTAERMQQITVDATREESPGVEV